MQHVGDIDQAHVAHTMTVKIAVHQLNWVSPLLFRDVHQITAGI